MTSLLSSDKARRDALLERGAGVTRVEIEVEGIGHDAVRDLLERVLYALSGLDGLGGAVLTQTIWEDVATGGEGMSGIHGRIAGDGLEPFGQAQPWWVETVT